MMYTGRVWIRRAMLLALAALSAGCESITYRDREPIEPAPAGAGQFLGYSSTESKRTACGNCHTGKQALWQQTAHAKAWTTLETSGAMEKDCQACHSVSSKGNVVTEPDVGWVATSNPRYKDVQCESCHGPGQTHVSNPDAVGTKPLAPLAVGTDLSRGCGECHSGTHRPFAEEWSKSKHARVVVSRATNPNCIGCHEAKGVLQSWGVKSTFMEENSTGDHLAVTCTVCHDPHDNRNPRQLRFSINAASVDDNLCMKCHRRRGVPDLASSGSGPHSPEGPLLLGEAGWIPPSFEYPSGTLIASHGSDRNPRLCATCHVNNYEIRDALTGAFSFRATGHSFQAIPCVNAEGIPTGEATCALTDRSFRACTTCHLTESAAATALTVAETRVSRLTAEIQGLIARIPASEFSTTDSRYTTGEGARFNMQLGLKKGSVVHNPFLLEALLLASIKQIGIDYNLKPSADLSLDPALAPAQ